MTKPVTENETLARLLEKTATIGTWRVDVKAQTCHWSDLTYEIHEEDKNKPIKLEEGINYYVPEHRPIISKCVEEGIEQNKPWDTELEILTAKGKRKWVRAIGEPVIEGGELTALHGVFQDIDAAKRTALALEDANSKLKLALDASKIGHWIWHIESNELIWDDRMFDVYGVSKNKFSSAYEAWANGLHPDDRERSELEVQDVLAGKKEFDTQFRIIDESGNVRDIRAAGEVIRDDQGNPLTFLGFNWNITEHMENQRQLARLNDELTQYAYRTSHDLKGPLSTIRGLTGVAKILIEEGSTSEAVENLEKIDNLANRLQGLIRDLFNLTRADYLDSAPEDFNFSKEVKSIVDAAAESYSAGKSVDLHIQNSLDGKFYCQTTRLKQIFENLTSNSIKYSKDDESVKLSVTVQSEGGRVEIRFKDNGVGIPKESQGQVFAMFQRFHHGVEGSGLGLYLIKKHVEALGGEISFESSPEGTEFKISLPNENPQQGARQTA